MTVTNASISVSSVSVKLLIEQPSHTRKPAAKADLHLEIHGTYCRLWYGSYCGDCFYLEPQPQSPYGHQSLTVADLPHLDVIYRLLAENYTRNRLNMVGAHLKNAVQAMETAIVARDGSSVYFACADDRIKIGWSRKVSTRLAQLQTGSSVPIQLLGTMPGGRALERELHERFAHLRLAGEWFKAAPDLLDFVYTSASIARRDG